MARKRKEQIVEDTQTGNDQTHIETSAEYTPEQIEASKKAMDELISLDQELGLYDLPEQFVEDAKKALEEVDAGEVTPYVKRTPSEAPVIDSEEESEDLDTKVLETGEIALNESEEVLEEGIDYHQSGLDGAKVTILDDVVTITTLDGETKDFLLPDESFTPEHFVYNSVGQPLPASLITIREMRLNTLVEKVIFAASLGAELYPRGISIDRAPYRVQLLIPTDKVEAYNSEEGKLVYSEDEGWLDVVVKASNGAAFLKRLIAVSKKGVVIAPNRSVNKTAGYSVPLKSKYPVDASGSVSVGVDKPIYSVEQLKSMKSDSLKIICGWYNIPFRGVSQARIDIKQAQEK